MKHLTSCSATLKASSLRKHIIFSAQRREEQKEGRDRIATPSDQTERPRGIQFKRTPLLFLRTFPLHAPPTPVSASARRQPLTGAADGDGEASRAEEEREQEQQPKAEGEEGEEDKGAGEGGETTQAAAETDDAAAVVHDYPPEADAAAVAIQSAWRGFSARKAYEEERVTRQWAAVKVQSFFRSRKARRVFAKHMRWVDGWVGGWKDGWGGIAVVVETLCRGRFGCFGRFEGLGCVQQTQPGNWNVFGCGLAPLGLVWACVGQRR